VLLSNASATLAPEISDVFVPQCVPSMTRMSYGSRSRSIEWR
jgi:hypothetical protein